jgi:hypothetical protein
MVNYVVRHITRREIHTDTHLPAVPGTAEPDVEPAIHEKQERERQCAASRDLGPIIGQPRELVNLRTCISGVYHSPLAKVTGTSDDFLRDDKRLF